MALADDADQFVRQLPTRHPDDYVPETIHRATVSTPLLRARIGHLEDENAALREAYFGLRDRHYMVPSGTTQRPARRRATQHARDTLLLVVAVCGVAIMGLIAVLAVSYVVATLHDLATILAR